jgi:SM-20-related protein
MNSAEAGALRAENTWNRALDSIARANVHSRPFSWCVIDDFLPSGVGHILSEEFPEAKFRLASDGGEDYSFLFRQLIRDGKIVEPSDLSSHWTEFARLLCSAEYRSAMSTLFSLSLDETNVVAGFALYPPGSGLRPHTDRPVRIVTQVVYFNESWESGWGGTLQLLRSSNPSDVAMEFDPKLGRSVLLVRSEHSWHAVRRVRRGIEEVRRSVLLHFTLSG